MRAIVERVNSACVTVDDQITGQIQQGFLVYVGMAPDDGAQDIAYMVDKIGNLRVFNDDDGKMNLSVRDIAGSLLVISAFALQADARKGRRPSFDAAAPPETASRLYDELCQALAQTGLQVERGIFRAHMHVTASNDGPICILLDSKRLF